LKLKFDEALSSSTFNFNLRRYNVELDKPFVARVVQRRDPSVQPRDPMQEAGASCIQRSSPFHLSCRLLLFSSTAAASDNHLHVFSSLPAPSDGFM